MSRLVGMIVVLVAHTFEGGAPQVRSSKAIDSPPDPETTAWGTSKPHQRKWYLSDNAGQLSHLQQSRLIPTDWVASSGVIHRGFGEDVRSRRRAPE